MKLALGMGCAVSQLDSVLSNKEQGDMMALIMIDEGSTVQPEIIEARELDDHNAAARAHFNMA